MTEFEIVYGIYHPRADLIFAKSFQTEQEQWFLRKLSIHQNYTSEEKANLQCDMLNCGLDDGFFVRESLREIK